MTSFDQFNSDYDFWYSGPVRTHYLICSTPRSDSHFLGHLMYASGTLGYPLEYFHPSHFAKWGRLSGRHDPLEVLQYIKKRRTSLNGCFGIKTHFAQFRHMCRLVEMEEALPGCRLIFVDRRDILSQAISLVKAKQTGAWISFHRKQREAKYEQAQIDEALVRIIDEKVSWADHLRHADNRVLRLSYEDFCEKPDRAIRSVSSHLGVETPILRQGARLPERQSDEQNQFWKRRYLEGAPEGFHAVLLPAVHRLQGCTSQIELPEAIRQLKNRVKRVLAIP